MGGGGGSREAGAGLHMLDVGVTELYLTTTRRPIRAGRLQPSPGTRNGLNPSPETLGLNPKRHESELPEP